MIHMKYWACPRPRTAAEIKAAFRKQAKQCHPDTHPGDAKKAAQFREISTAHEILSDQQKRAQYDRGEINADGSQRRSSAPISMPGNGQAARLSVLKRASMMIFCRNFLAACVAGAAVRPVRRAKICAIA